MIKSQRPLWKHMFYTFLYPKSYIFVNVFVLYKNLYNYKVKIGFIKHVRKWKLQKFSGNPQTLRHSTARGKWDFVENRCQGHKKYWPPSY